MSELIELTCKNCGGSLDPVTLKCEYCGTRYAKKEERGVTHYIQTCPAKVQTVAAQVCVSEIMLHRAPADEVSEFTMRELTHYLAEALAPYMKIETTKDLCNMTQIIRGSVRVVEPDFRF